MWNRIAWTTFRKNLFSSIPCFFISTLCQPHFRKSSLLWCNYIVLQRTISRILKEEFFGKTICKGNGRIGFEQRSEEIIREVAANPRWNNGRDLKGLINRCFKRGWIKSPTRAEWNKVSYRFFWNEQGGGTIEASAPPRCTRLLSPRLEGNRILEIAAQRAFRSTRYRTNGPLLRHCVPRGGGIATELSRARENS